MSGTSGDGADATTINWIFFPWPQESVDLLNRQWDEAVALWRELAIFARDHGVEKIALELHPLHLVYNVPTLLRMREAVGPILGANVDPSHLFWQQMNPVAVVRALGEAVHHVHLKDTELIPEQVAIAGVLDDRAFSDPQQRAWIQRTIGRGHNAEFWSAFINALLEIGYQGAVSIENEDPFQAYEEGVREAAAFSATALENLNKGAAQMEIDRIVEINMLPDALAKPIPRHYRVGLIAAGRIVQSEIMSAYRAAGIMPVAAADPDPAARDSLQAQWGVERVFTDYREMLDTVEIDFVDINLRWDVGLSQTRVDAVAMAAQRGIHVIIAKPMAENWEQCKAMVAHARRGGVILAVDQNTRFGPAFYGCRALIRAGALGKLLSASINYHSALGRQHTNAFHAVHDVCVHGVDILLSWFGEEPHEGVRALEPAR